MKRRKDRNLAEGEATGHAHVVTDEKAIVYDVDDLTRELDAPSVTTVTHEEHREMEIEAGHYRIRRQVEIDPDTEEINQVRD